MGMIGAGCHTRGISRLIPVLVITVAIVIVAVYFLGFGSHTQTTTQQEPGIMMIDSANITGNTTMTAYLSNVGSHDEVINTAYVDGLMVSMSNASGYLISSITLTPNSGALITLASSSTNWTDGASHQLKFVATDGASAVYSVPAFSGTASSTTPVNSTSGSTGMLSISAANITGPHVMTICLNNTGNQTEAIGTAYVDNATVTIYSLGGTQYTVASPLVLAPGSGSEVIIMSFGSTEWDDGNPHQVVFVANDGTSVTCNAPFASATNPQGVLSIDSATINNDGSITAYLRDAGTLNATVNAAYVDGVPVNMSVDGVSTVTLFPGSLAVITLTGTANWADGNSHQIEFVASDGTSATYNVSANSAGSMEMLSVDNASINNNTCITAYLMNAGSQNETINTAYVDGEVVSMIPASMTLTPASVEQVVLTSTSATWADGNSHQVEFVATDGTSVTYTLSY